MANNDTAYPILNPYTPLAFLPPDMANQFEVTGYVYIATLAAYTWDWLKALPEEYKIFRRGRLNPANIAYLLSRIGSLGFCVTAVVSAVAPVAHCQALQYIIGFFYEVSLPATSLLFFFRVKAVYAHGRVITLFFGALWFAILGLSILPMVAIRSDHIPNTQHCTETVVGDFVSVPAIITAVYDTLVFIAISAQMVVHTLNGDTWTARTRSFVYGNGMYSLSRALLRGGQIYYFATVGISILYIVLNFASSFPEELRLILGLATVALPSAMACYVFRALLLGIIDDDGLVLGGAGSGGAETGRTTLRFAKASALGLRDADKTIVLRDLGGPSSSRYKSSEGMSTTVGGEATDDCEHELERKGTRDGSVSDAVSQV
ncbi:hypothetical protein FIBSPDRAFT_816544 [Athelia psychrophila]|uniref:DUF6533 domain-containing protein n=1 Tax=Athelia psychrophila TaxID=1759441 RepID=A0A166S9P9_9AGAM|nr:hypothetical protein FIBSPDRAFT_840705 [Fibularhizoctonia sp. CBS 109695]KZP29190.1 hypothetical protein FIBSPDRAFT_816544 [Fibularhizoctonia sp. CBS 109695]